MKVIKFIKCDLEFLKGEGSLLCGYLILEINLLLCIVKSKYGEFDYNFLLEVMDEWMKWEELILLISFYKKIVNVVCYVKIMNCFFDLSLEKIKDLLYCEFECEIWCIFDV